MIMKTIWLGIVKVVKGEVLFWTLMGILVMFAYLASLT